MKTQATTRDKTQATTRDVENLLNEDYKETMKTLKPKLIPMTEEEEYRNAGITKEEINGKDEII